jgi:hypothetical protein
MPGRSIYFISQIIAIRHNHQVVCHQLLYVLLIFIDGGKDEIKNLISKFFFKNKKIIKSDSMQR